MPSKVILEQKQKAVAELAEQIKNSVSGVLVNYQGITVEDDTAMRKALREAGVKYMVVKNTLTGRACEAAGYADMKQYLSGMTAIAISEKDAVGPAKVLKKYADKVESFKILAGYLDGAVIRRKDRQRAGRHSVQRDAYRQVPREHPVSSLRPGLRTAGHRRQADRGCPRRGIIRSVRPSGKRPMPRDSFHATNISTFRRY